MVCRSLHGLACRAAAVWLMAAGLGTLAAGCAPEAAPDRPGDRNEADEEDPISRPTRDAASDRGSADRTAPDGMAAVPGPDAARDGGPDAEAAPDIVLPAMGIDFAAERGVVLWLDAARNVTAQPDPGQTGGDPVERWSDLSREGNHATQSNAARRPRLVKADDRGRPVLRFQSKIGTYLAIADSPSMRWGAGDFAMLFVAANRAPIVRGHLNSWGYLYRKASSEVELVSLGYNWPDGCVDGRCRDDSARAGTAIRNLHDFPAAQTRMHPVLNDGKMRLVVSRRRGKTLEIRVNGERSGSVDHAIVTNLDFTGKPAYLGLAQPDGVRSFRFEGDMAEVVLIKGTVDDETLGRLERALIAKHGLM